MNAGEFSLSEEKRRVAIYIRVSTTEQKIDGYGLEAQKSRLVAYVEQNLALNLYTKPEWIFEDTHTGSELARPDLQRLLAAVKNKKFDAVLVWKIDRLSRSLQHLLSIFEELEKNNVSFISVQENIDFKGPIGKLIFQIFGAIAQFERELIKGRTHMGRIASAEMGNFTGTAIPFGYTPVLNPNGKGRRLEIIPEEKHWVVEMFNWYIYEGLGDGQIAKRLNEYKVARGVHKKSKDRGSKWTPEMVSTILVNPLYRGAFVANQKNEAGQLLPSEQWTVVAIPPCISEFVFTQLQEVRKSRHGGAVNTTYLLSGKLKDMTLDYPYAFSGCKRSKGGFSYRRKQFTDRQGEYHPVFEVPGKPIEDYVWGKIMEALKNPEVFIKHYLSKGFRDKDRVEKIEAQILSLRERRANIDVERERIEQAYEAGVYSEESLQAKLSSKATEGTQVDQKLQDLEGQLSLMGAVDLEVQKLKEASEQVKYRLDHLDVNHKKILCSLFIDRVEMHRIEYEGKKKVKAEIFFRFNPSKLDSLGIEGSTEKGLAKAKKEPLKAQNEKDGRSGGT